MPLKGWTSKSAGETKAGIVGLGSGLKRLIQEVCRSTPETALNWQVSWISLPLVDLLVVAAGLEPATNRYEPLACTD